MPTKIRDIIRILEEDGWQWERTRGSHRVYSHPTKSGIVVVPGKRGKDRRSAPSGAS
ncbi:MAG: type II toxin-antitoxin system HicA family toxin [Pseudonocardiaceae bacterium]